MSDSEGESALDLDWGSFGNSPLFLSYPSSIESSDGDSSSSPFSSGEPPKRFHERRCREGDGWSHAFSIRRICRDAGAAHLSISDARREVMPFFTIENWEKMSRGISQYVALTRLRLVSTALSEEAIGALFGGGCACNFPQLERLDLSHNELTPGSIRALLPFLKSRPAIKALVLVATHINDEGARLLSDALDQMRIGELHLRMNSLGNDGIEFLLSAHNSRYLTLLDLRARDGETAGLDAISQFLEKDDTELGVLAVSIAGIERAKMLIESVSSKSKLHRLDLGYTRNHNDEQVKEMMPAIQNLVCNTSSFESLCESNHLVRDIDGLKHQTLRRRGAPTALTKAIEINARKSQSISQKLRSKLRKFYFQGEFDVQPIAKISVKLIPHVLEFVTKAEVVVHKTRVDDTPHGEEVKVVDGMENYYEVCSKNVGGIYRLIRNCHIPDLFSFPSPESKMREQETEIAALKVTNAKVKNLEAKIAALEEVNAQLVKENEELQAGSGSAQPNKRAKTGSA